MDFLKIRKKARERSAAARAAKGEAKGASKAPPGATPPPDPVLTEADVLDGALAARLQGLPAPGSERFAVWRPGAGDPLDVEPADPPAPPLPPAAAGPALRGALLPIGGPPSEGAPPRDPLDAFFYREDEEAPPIPTFAGGAEAEADPDAPVALAEYLTFALAGEHYALPIEHVREVLKSPPVTEVPRAPAHVLGVVTVRGEVMAVCDPRRRLALPGDPPAGPAARLVVADAGEGPCALLVDGVLGVVRVARGALEPCPQGIGGAAAECLAGIGREGDRLFTALDTAALLGRVAPARGAEGPVPPRRPGGDGEDRRAGA